MKSLTFWGAALLWSVSLTAADTPLWLRYPAISPDGSTIAFSYKGDIFTVPAKGGRATQLTSNPAHDTRPIWSPDGSRIAFASDRNGNFDIFVMSREGGIAKRLTTNSASEMPETFLDDSHVLYSASIMPDVNDSQFPSGQFPQIYSVSTDGGRPELYSSLAMQDIKVSPKGDRLLYHDMKGYEDKWRKHHQSSITRDIWVCDLAPERKFSKLTTFRGEDRNPVWTPDGSGYYYLSEENGSFNVYKSDFAGNHKRITDHSKHPVRFLSGANDGTLCYAWDGEIYTLRDGSKPAKVQINIVSDKTENDLIQQLRSSGATDIAVSPNGKEVAFVLRGDVYVTSVEYETTKQITDTPWQERNVDFSPDGRSLVYSSERDNGTWGIYTTTIGRDDDKYFTYARDLKEEPLVVTDRTSFQPMYSPDGKEVAFLEDRTTLRVINLDTKAVRTVLDGKYNYSYSDGDQTYQWSPDSKWFLAKFIDHGGWNNTDIVLVKADGSGEMTNLTESGYSDDNPKWVLDGKAMIWSSDRAGYRSHGSWGAQNDVYIMFFDGDAYDNFRLSKEEQALLDELKKDDESQKEKTDADKKDAKSKKKDSKPEDKKDDSVKPLKFDLANRKDRVMRLTGNSSFLGDALLSPKGDKLYYCASFEGGYDLWEHNLKENTTKLLIKDVGGNTMHADKKGENVFIVSRGGIKKIEIKDSRTKPVAFKADFAYRPAQERDYIFHHAWRQVADKFYDPEIHGIDWADYCKEYEKYLPHVTNGYDFSEMLGEMLGELNGSHTGARFYGNSATVSEPATAVLGAFYDNAYQGDGLKIAEVLVNGPLTKADSKIGTGCIIESIDEQPIKAGADYYPQLKGKAGKTVLLGLYDPATGKRWEEQVKPISAGAQNNLLYKRWVEQKRQMVDRLSGGKVGYVHVKGMDSPSFREVYSELLGRCRNKEAVIVDTRHNGGGWLHDDLATLLSGQNYAKFMPRGQFIGNDPFNKWLKPSCVLVCEDNYSNAHGFPWVYKTLGIGKLIGAPVPGTMTAVWWETQIDPQFVFGIPQVGVQDMQGRYLENLELQPDIEIYNSPESQLRGEDAQLERAVKEMLSL